MLGGRLLVAYVVALVLTGTAGYFVVDHKLRGSQLETYAAAQQADARSFERIGAEASSPGDALRRIDAILQTIARRPGTIEVALVDGSGRVQAGGGRSRVGSKLVDGRIRKALDHGAVYAGAETNPSFEADDFEFVSPVDVSGHRYAYDVTYDNAAFDAQVRDVRFGLAVVGLLALVGGGLVFYLVGGRSLVRRHRSALERATRDGLTGLPNQRAFHDDLPQAVATAARGQGALSMFVMDVDDFKFLNDRYGHPYGDEVLTRVAGVLRDGRAGDRAYRTGGDEFAALLPHTDADGALLLSRRVSRSIAETGVKVSIGVSTLRPGQPADELRAEADAALYDAKRRGGNGVALFDEIRGDVVVTTSQTAGAVRTMIEERGIDTVFQPIWNLQAGTLLGVEALTRPHAKYDLSGPAEAFDVAQQLGRVHELDGICIANALAAVPPLPNDALIFLNVCPQTLDIDSDRDDWLLVALSDAAVPLERVVIEVTERFAGRTASIVKCLEQLRLHGLKIALDDVGTGNSGLEMLRKVNADFVKLDQSIVDAATIEPSARAVLMAMATYAHQTGAFVIAEGIQDEDTLEFLCALNDRDDQPHRIIGGGQGFTLGRPTPHIDTACPPVLQSNNRQPRTTTWAISDGTAIQPATPR
jgi:diguanylate cyclase (GGDEF)-like protein